MRRRTFLALGSAALISCTKSDGEYFGRTAPPTWQNLAFALGGDPVTLDPAKSTGFWEFYVIPVLFEGLTQFHPELPEPMAAVATHYESSRNETRYTFYLRGHPAPQGKKLPGHEVLHSSTRGQSPGVISNPALWSDGTPLTAHDFAYSWRRFIDPASAAPLAYQMYCVRNAEEIQTGKCPPRELGVRALDDFTFEVDLRSPTPFFLALIMQYLFSAVPRQAIAKAGSAWTEPPHIITSGPFALREWRRYEKLTVVRNPAYHDADSVALDEVTFYPIADQTTAVNLYKAGVITATSGLSLPPLLIPLLSRKKDFWIKPALGTGIAAINTRRPPFDNVLLRYALNMATDKVALARFLGGGRVPAREIVPQFEGYTSPASLPVAIDGRTLDVLAFDAEGAKEMFVRATGGSPLEFSYHCGADSESRELAEILQQQWQRTLNVKVKVVVRENSVHWNMVLSADYSGVGYFQLLPTYMDPNPFLDPFMPASGGNPAGWTDTEFISTLYEANATVQHPERMRRLAHCEKLLLAAMPVLPMYHESWRYLAKPFIRNLTCNAFDMRSFKYAWIDTNWKPGTERN